MLPFPPRGTSGPLPSATSLPSPSSPPGRPPHLFEHTSERMLFVAEHDGEVVGVLSAVMGMSPFAWSRAALRQLT